MDHSPNTEQSTPVVLEWHREALYANGVHIGTVWKGQGYYVAHCVIAQSGKLDTVEEGKAFLEKIILRTLDKGDSTTVYLHSLIAARQHAATINQSSIKEEETMNRFRIAIGGVTVDAVETFNMAQGILKNALLSTEPRVAGEGGTGEIYREKINGIKLEIESSERVFASYRDEQTGHEVQIIHPDFYKLEKRGRPKGTETADAAPAPTE